MNSYEEQLIVELASGSLPEDDARRLEASLSTEARRELAAHRLVLRAIAAADAPAMTDIERAGMHRGVAEGLSDVTRELNATQIATPAGHTPQRARTIRWMRYASAAAAAAVLVGVVAVGTQLAGTSSDSNDVVSADFSTETTAAGGVDARADDTAVTTLAGAFDTVPPAAATTTTNAAAERAFTPLAQAPSVGATTEEADLEEVARFLTGLEVTNLELSPGAELACFDVADGAAANQELVKAFTLQYFNRAAVGYQTDAVDDDEAIRIYDLQTCEELATAPR